MSNPFVAPRSQVHVSGSQVRLARGLTGWTQAELSKIAGVHIDFVKRIEGDEWVSTVVARRIRRTFEARKVIFLLDANPYIAA